MGSWMDVTVLFSMPYINANLGKHLNRVKIGGGLGRVGDLPL